MCLLHKLTYLLSRLWGKASSTERWLCSALILTSGHLTRSCSWNHQRQGEKGIHQDTIPKSNFGFQHNSRLLTGILLTDPSSKKNKMRYSIKKKKKSGRPIRDKLSYLVTLRHTKKLFSIYLKLKLGHLVSFFALFLLNLAKLHIFLITSIKYSIPGGYVIHICSALFELQGSNNPTVVRACL